MSDQHPQNTTPLPPDAEPLPEPPPVTEDEVDTPLAPDAEPLPDPAAASGSVAEPLDRSDSTDEASAAHAGDEATAARATGEPVATAASEAAPGPGSAAAPPEPEDLSDPADLGDPAHPADLADPADPADPVEPADSAVDEPLDHSASDPVDAADEDIEEGPAPLGDDELDSALEALLLVVDSPVDEAALATALDTTPLRVAEHLRLLSDRYTDRDRGIDLRRVGGGWRFYTRDRYAPYVEKLLLDGQRAKLTRAALETLAVIAYRQPVTRARVAAVRGVNCDGVIRTLLARGLVEETGTDQETGGFLYRTTELFLERLGLSSLEDLPPIAPLLPEVDSIDEL